MRIATKETRRVSPLFVRLYRVLLTAFGPQHWWPGETPFEVMVGAVLTQNTNWRNVERAIANLKAAKVLAPGPLSRLGEEELARLVAPSGFFRVKARRLKALLDWLMETAGGDLGRLRRRPLARLRRELLAIPGIGPETADSILLYALGKPTFVVDAYTCRALHRHGLIGPRARYDEVKTLFESSLPHAGGGPKSTENRGGCGQSPHLDPPPVGEGKGEGRGSGRQQAGTRRGGRPSLPGRVRLFNEYHALFVELGKRFCRPRPRCAGCPAARVLGQPRL